jgi:hypothetical protein
MTEPHTIHQPIHPDIRSRLDPEYISFHEEKLQYILQSEASEWDPVQRSAPSAFSPPLESVEVSSVQDVILKYSELRIFTPKGSSPAGGRPVFLWYAPFHSCFNDSMSRVCNGQLRKSVLLCKDVLKAQFYNQFLKHMLTS